MGLLLPIYPAILGWSDSLILMIMALVVFGPRRLPQIGRQIGKLMYEFRKASNDFKFQMEEELRLAEDADRRKKEEERLKALNAQTPQPVLAQPAAPPQPAPAAEPAAESTTEPASSPAVPASEPEPAAPTTGPTIQPPSEGETVAAARPGARFSQAAEPAPAEQPAAAAEAPAQEATQNG